MTIDPKVDEILTRVMRVAGPPWKYNPQHEMFVGTTHAIEMYSRTLDLGRAGGEFAPSKDPDIKGYVRTEQSKRNLAEVEALGLFLAHCREDIEYLITALQNASITSK